MEYILYIDEAGCPGQLPSQTSDVQPIFCITGIIVPREHLSSLTHEFLDLKRRFNPKHFQSLRHDLEIMLYEIKGSDLRSDIRGNSRNKRRRAFGILDKTFDLLEKYNCKLLARGYIKRPAGTFDGNAVYTASMQAICGHFENFLAEQSASGVVIADSRKKHQNNRVSHSIFTKKFQQNGDSYPSIIEMPVFGHSENHVGLQISDWIASAVLFPALSHVYCTGHVQSVHINPRHELIKNRYSNRIRNLQYRYQINGRFRGGITVIDGILESRSAALLFR